jgi:TRAP-type C4-dicarboxylate transport system substrate-binding protein
LDFYDQLPKEDRKIIISNASLYGKRAKKYPKAKQSYN